MPVIIAHYTLVLQSFRGIFVNVAPLTSVTNFIECDGIIQLNFNGLISILMLNLLAALILVNDSLRKSCHISVLTIWFVLYQLLKLLVELILALLVFDQRQVLDLFFERGIRVRIISREPSDLGTQESRFVPEVVAQVVKLMILLHNTLHLHTPIRLILLLELALVLA